MVFLMSSCLANLLVSGSFRYNGYLPLGSLNPSTTAAPPLLSPVLVLDESIGALTPCTGVRSPEMLGIPSFRNRSFSADLRLVYPANTTPPALL